MNNDLRRDTPDDWDRYRQALQRTPHRIPGRGRAEAMRDAVMARTRSGRNGRDLLAGAGGIVLALVLAVFLFGIDPFGDVVPAPTPAPAPVAKSVPEPRRSAPRHFPRRLPVVPPSAVQADVDTAIPSSPGNYPGHHPTVPPVPSASTGR